MKKRDIYITLMMLICIAIPMITLAQGPNDPNDVPIDGGLSLLVAAGVAYGAKKYRNARKAKNHDEPYIK